MTKLHLICNAHLDPVWLWDWEEGNAAALSTFRIAAKFCREYDGFVFNHNEAILYQWVEEYEPDLFQEIQELVKLGKWHIMGGWFLQPDCNMPSGESFIRQIEEGREYFKEKFGVVPTTAINFDPFGHSRGLVQIMEKTGYDSYVFCRPIQEDCPLPDDDFLWVGFDGSAVKGHRSSEHYNSLMGEAGKKIQDYLDSHKDQEEGFLLWGVGNHGGGPSRIDMRLIREKQEEHPECKMIHSVPEDYFSEIEKETLARVEHDLNSWAVGCYTSQIQIKQKHRKLEGLLYMTEKMVSQAVIQGKMEYPQNQLKEAEKALLTVEFHDILPGSAVKSVEESGIQIMNYGMEILEKQKRRAFFALSEGEKPAGEGEYPILIYNPHPYTIEGIVTCEFQMQNQNWSSSFGMPRLYQDGKEIPCQVEKEACNMNLDWRKEIVFHTALKPMQMNRYDCIVEFLEKEPKRSGPVAGDAFVFRGEELETVISKKTGLMESLKIDGKEFLKGSAFGLSVRESGFDPWGMTVSGYPTEAGKFTLLSEEEGRDFSAVDTVLESVRIVEDGVVRTVVEALFGYRRSRAAIRYLLPKKGRGFDLEVDVEWLEKGKLLKLEIPTALQGKNLCETAYGVQEYENSEKERVFQRWSGVFDETQNMALTCINSGCYGGEFRDGVMAISLVNSAAYSAHPIEDRILLDQDRRIRCMDQGERNYLFRIQAGGYRERRERVTQDAVIFQETPMAVAFFPTEKRESEKKWFRMSEEGCVLSAMKKIKGKESYLLRFFESTGESREVKLNFWDGTEKKISLKPYEIKTMEFFPDSMDLDECSMLPSVFGSKK